MNTFFCSQCGHTTGQAKETETGVFCPQCGWRMEREDVRQENVQQQITSSLPVTVEAASLPQELKRYPIKFNTVSAVIGQNIREQNMLFKPGDRVRYDGQDMEKFGLKAGMEGEVVRCFQNSVDVYYNDLRRVVHFMDFHMRTSLKRLPAANTAQKSRSPRRQIIRLIAWVVLIIAIVLIMISILKSIFPKLKLISTILS